MSKSRDKRTVGGRIRKLRESLDLSQQALADAAGLRQATISDIECRHVDPDLDTLRRIARVLGTSVGDLVD